MLSYHLQVTKDQAIIHASVQPPPGLERVPSDICCVIDVSGSMDAEAKFKNLAGDWESHGLSLLDIVKHAVKTVVHAMGPQDRISVVVFSNQGNLVLQQCFLFLTCLSQPKQY